MKKKQQYQKQGIKNIPKKPQQDQISFQTVKSIPLIETYHQRLQKNFNYLKSVLVKWGITTMNFPNTNQKRLLMNYLQYYQEFTDGNQFQNSFELLPTLNINLERISSQEIIYKSFNIFKNTLWPVRFGSKFISRMSQLEPNQIKFVLSFVMMAAEGHLPIKSGDGSSTGTVKSIQTTFYSYNRFLLMTVLSDYKLVISVGVEKKPIVGKNGLIKRYEYQSYMMFWDLTNINIQINKINQKLRSYVDRLKQDISRKDHGDQLVVQQDKSYQRKKYLFGVSQNPYTLIPMVIQNQLCEGRVYFPNIFKVNYPSTAEASTLIFNASIKRWVPKGYTQNLQQQAFNLFQKKVNQEMIKKYVDFQSAKTLVELLTKIPNFKIQLTQEQKDVIGQNGNVMVIGRSGTGKTTCAILRLFSIEMLFKIRLSIQKKKNQGMLKNTNCSADDIDQTLGLHSIFLTASPVLTHQIQRYYKKITDNIKDQLQKKKKREIEKRKIQMQEQAKRAKLEKLEESINQDFEDLNSSSSKIQQLKVEQNTQKQQQKSITQEIKQLQIKQQQDQQFKQGDQFDQLVHQFQQKLQKLSSLDDLQQKDFPGFFTVKSFIMMVDGTLKKPFFIRNKHNATNNLQSKAAWHNQQKGVMMIQNYYRNNGDQNKIETIQQIQDQINYSDQEQLQHQYLRQLQLRQNKAKQALTKKLNNKKTANISFEIDYDYFRIHFWPTVYKYTYSSKSITDHLVFTEIFSTIKGSANSHLYPGYYLPQKYYIQHSSNVFLSKQQKKQVYQAFCQYERWKMKVGGYDIMDTVNYILNYIRFVGYYGPQIHYLMIDQIQDLPHAIIYLLSKIASHGVFYSGDTAQTIAKGVGFRFCDLKNLFNKRLLDECLKLKPPTVMQLTVNFRSHNNILQLANSVISCIQILFPKTIDRLKKERSDLDGPKPMIINSQDLELLFFVLSGVENKKVNNISPLQFGCEQVVIVRDQQSKKNVPRLLEHALCLTIYQAKGLEFNDVILFNFFTQSKCPDKWGILKYLTTQSMQLTKEQYQKSITKHRKVIEQEQQELQDPTKQQIEVENVCIVDTKQQVYSIKKIKGQLKLLMKDLNTYAQICSQLKMLYTAITRPKKNLIIYDQNPACRKTMERLWNDLGVVLIIDRQLVQKSQSSIETKIFKTIMNQTSKQEWRKQGLKMYSRRYFQQAKKCFQNSGNQDLYKKAHANQLADNCTRKLIQTESKKHNLKEGVGFYSQMPKTQIKLLQKQFKRTQNQCYREFIQAGKLFQDLKMLKQAGQCYFSGRGYQQAQLAFRGSKMYKQTAESLEMQKKYKEAAIQYQKVDDYLKVIECLDMVNEWELIIQSIGKFSNLMTDFEKQTLLKKYACLLLESLTYQIQFQNQQNIQQKQPQKKQVQIIQEQNSDQQDQSEDQDQQDQDEQQQSQKQQQIEIKQQQKKNLDKEPKIEQNQIQNSNINEIQSQQNNSKIIELIQQPLKKVNDQNQQVKKQVKKQDATNKQQESFQQLNKSDQQKQPSFSDLNVPQIPQSESSFSQLNQNGQMQLDMESIKSMVEPQDLWVKSALSSIQHQSQSQFSILNDENNYLSKARIIKTKGNIFVQQSVMNKIMNVTSIVNSNIQFLKQFKGYQSLLSMDPNQKINIPQQPKQIDQFQQLTPQMVNIALDTLQSFKLYKLCLFVCNRYHIVNRIGRYLLSISIKYSTNCQQKTSLNPALLSPTIFRKKELQKGVLASIALHAILQNVNPQFLKLKINNSQKNCNSLGNYFVEGLILQGLLKKAVCMVNKKQSLKLLYNYCDYKAYRQFLLEGKINQNNEITFLSKPPSSIEQLKLLILWIEDIITKYSIVNSLENISQRVYKQLNTKNLKNGLQIQIPNYLPFLSALFKGQQETLNIFIEKAEQLNKIINSQKHYEVYDLIITVCLILNHQKMISYLIKSFELKQFVKFYQLIKTIKQSITKLHNSNSLRHLQIVFSVYQCRMIHGCKSLNFINDGFSFVQRKSIIVNDLLQMTKKKQNNFAYFFEQEYNYILVKSTNIIQMIKKRFSHAILKFLMAKKNERNPKHLNLFKQDIISENNHKILNVIVQMDLNKIKMDIFKKKDFKQKQKTTVKRTKKMANKLYQFHHNTLIDYLEQLSDSYSQDEQLLQQSCSYIRCIGTYSNIFGELLSSLVLNQFSKKKSDHIQGGNILFALGMNRFYRQYVQRLGGYNLFDAIQFKKFKRLDLYADNILSIITNLPIKDKIYLIKQILVLLLIQYKIIEKQPTKIYLDKKSLKYLDNLQYDAINQRSTKKPINLKPNKSQIIPSLMDSSNYQCVFSYNSFYGIQLTKPQLIEMICQYLDVLKKQLTSDDIFQIVVTYLINIEPQPLIYEQLRLLVKLITNKNIDLIYNLCQTNNYEQFLQHRKQILQFKNFILQFHLVNVYSKGNIQKYISESEEDYQIEGALITLRKSSVKKIESWWKKVRKNKIKQEFISQKLTETRILKITNNIPYISFKDKLLNNSSSLRQDLIQFYLKNIVTSSLDFHFIMMSLNNIQDIREKYLNSLKIDGEYLIGQSISELYLKINQLYQTTQIWKKDQKWLKNQNFDLKKRKVFEVKWMTKLSLQHKVIKKRAGLKKQQKLKAKKLLIKLNQ